MSEKDEKNFENGETCWMCEQHLLIKSQCILSLSHKKNFKKKNKLKSVPDRLEVKKVRDSCTIKAKYGGAAHVICNINTRLLGSHFATF